MVNNEVARKSFHPTEVPRRSQMTEHVTGFQEISGNAIILSRLGHTLCAVLSGEFGVASLATSKIMESMRTWKEDPAARVPPAAQGTKRKRSYDQRNYVSLCCSVPVRLVCLT